jgi:hypothetical protein
MQRGPGLAACFLTALALLSHSAAAASPARRAAPRSPDLDRALAELRREYVAHVKDPTSHPLRRACDYFNGETASVPLEALLVVLEKPLPGPGGGGDPRVVAYVKWQLLSALPAELDVEAVDRLVRVYERAPLPPPRFGCAAGEQRRLDKLLPGARPQDDVPLTAKLQHAVDQAAHAHAPILAYRDELYRRLPTGKAKFLAGLTDAEQRLGVAASTEALGEALLGDLPEWSGVAATPRADVHAVAERLGKLRFVESPPYYASAAVRRGRLTWVTDTGTLLTKRRSATLHKLLLESAGVPDLDAATAAGGQRARAGSVVGPKN